MTCNKFKHANCPPRPVTPTPQTKFFENCVAVSDTSNTNNNIVYLVDTDIDAVLAASFENTGTTAFNVNFIFNTSGSVAYLVQPGDSITVIYNDVREIALTGTSPTIAYHGIFKYQVAYSFDI